MQGSRQQSGTRGRSLATVAAAIRAAGLAAIAAIAHRRTCAVFVNLVVYISRRNTAALPVTWASPLTDGQGFHGQRICRPSRSRSRWRRPREALRATHQQRLAENASAGKALAPRVAGRFSTTTASSRLGDQPVRSELSGDRALQTPGRWRSRCSRPTAQQPGCFMLSPALADANHLQILSQSHVRANLTCANLALLGRAIIGRGTVGTFAKSEKFA